MSWLLLSAYNEGVQVEPKKLINVSFDKESHGFKVVDKAVEKAVKIVRN